MYDINFAIISRAQQAKIYKIYNYNLNKLHFATLSSETHFASCFAICQVQTFNSYFDCNIKIAWCKQTEATDY